MKTTEANEYRIQVYMDSAYARYKTIQGDAEHFTVADFYAGLTDDEKSAVSIGNLNYQVYNGGFGQWYSNGYVAGVGTLYESLDRLNTRCAKVIKSVVKRACRNLGKDDSEFDSEENDVLEHTFYMLSEQLLAELAKSLPERREREHLAGQVRGTMQPLKKETQAL
jgi:hypothetical protein